ncbi:MAG TPA: hypothetical protein VHI99_05475 [Vicinamibacterales bacterium]|nr:hypothetical protein [Vicinamibacterales bacterium]
MLVRQGFLDERRDRSARFFPQELTVLSAQEVAAVKSRQAQEGRLPFGVPEPPECLDPVLVAQ